MVDSTYSMVKQVLNKLEWCGIYTFCTGWPSCPICRGIKPGFGVDENGNYPINSGHKKDCDLNNLIDSLTKDG